MNHNSSLLFVNNFQIGNKFQCLKSIDQLNKLISLHFFWIFFFLCFIFIAIDRADFIILLMEALFPFFFFIIIKEQKMMNHIERSAISAIEIKSNKTQWTVSSENMDKKNERNEKVYAMKEIEKYTRNLMNEGHFNVFSFIVSFFSYHFLLACLLIIFVFCSVSLLQNVYCDAFNCKMN